MAEFEVPVVKIDDVIDHPNADRLTIVKIGGYNCIANKKEDGSWRYQAGDLVVYIPEQAVVPEWLLKTMGFWNDEDDKGMLNGPKGDRVKAIKLRGTFSQGILMPLREDDEGPFVFVDGNSDFLRVSVGDDVAEYLGITKYEPPIPTHMAGEVWNASGMTLNFDVENIQKHPDVFTEGEEVQVTEKLHGTWTCMGLGFDGKDYHDIVTSKGLSSRGLAFKANDENSKNLYMRMLEATRNDQGTVLQRMRVAQSVMRFGTGPVYLLGETFGKGVQDLGYGEDTPSFRGFDIYVGQPGQGEYLGVDEKNELFKALQIDIVPELFRGAFDIDKMTELRDGRDFSDSNIREGVVIRPVEERRDDVIGRVMLKFVSPKYILRKGGTELN